MAGSEVLEGQRLTARTYSLQAQQRPSATLWSGRSSMMTLYGQKLEPVGKT